MKHLDGPFKAEPLFYTKGIALENGSINGSKFVGNSAFIQSI